jgi:hypothetical protein
MLDKALIKVRVVSNQSTLFERLIYEARNLFKFWRVLPSLITIFGNAQAHLIGHDKLLRFDE